MPRFEVTDTVAAAVSMLVLPFPLVVTPMLLAASIAYQTP
jgi:hypothetical protein